MKKILIFFVLFLFPFLVNAEGNVFVSSVENIYEEESGISIDESESRNIIFNDIGQSFKYKVVLENVSDETLVVENIKLSEPVVDFMKYGVFDIEVGEELEAGAKKELYVTVDSLSDKGYGYNFADTLNLEVVFNEKIENPITVDIIVLVILSFVVSAVFFIYYKYNNKVSLCFLFIPLMIGGISFVRANDVIKINFDSNISFKSQNVIETTGIYYVENEDEFINEQEMSKYIDHSHDSVFDVTVDLWKYRNNIKEIFVENEIREIDDYVYKFDISEEKNEKVIAYLVTNKDDNTLYDCYIMANGLIYANNNSQGLFAEMYNLEEINNLAGIDFSETTNMAMLFYKAHKLTELDVTSLDTSKVVDMSFMFFENELITSIDVSNYDTSNVVDMYSMFDAMKSLKKLDVSNFDTSSLVNMNMMFMYLTSLTELELGDFETNNVKYMQGTFYNMPYLEELDVSSFDTSNVVDMSFLFGGYPLGTYNYSGFKRIIGLESFDTSNVTTMDLMFQNCSKLESLDLSSFDTSNVTTMLNFAINCYNLKNLNLSNFDFSRVNNLKLAFYRTGYYVSDFYVDLSGFDFNNFSVETYDNAFYLKSTHKILVMNENSKNWFLNKGWFNVNESTVFVKGSNVNSVEGIEENNIEIFPNLIALSH